VGQIRFRAFKGPDDLPAMAALARQQSAETLHIVDLPYRFSSWAMDNPDGIGLWDDERERLVGWAVMQTPFWSIDYVFDRNAGAALHTQIVQWADESATRLLGTDYGRPIWFINAFADQPRRIDELESLGFSSQADVGENSWTKVLMRVDADATAPERSVPDGFLIRPLAGAAEVDAYVALHRAVFNSTSMTAQWRARTLSQPGYVAELDLVAVAPDGRLAGFCICWLARLPNGETVGQVEPLGVHEDFRALGLGRALLLEGLRRLVQNGATSVLVETDNYRDEAFKLYESAGFRVHKDVLVFRKDFAPLE